MTHSSKRTAIAAVLLLAGSAAAQGQGVQVSRIAAAPPDQPLAVARQQRAAPQPKGIPGYLDPATGLFQPLVQSDAAPKTYNGTIAVTFHLKLQPAVQGADLLCSVNLHFGHTVGSDFFSDQASNVVFTFPARSPTTIKIPYIYKTSNTKPSVTEVTSCQVSGGFGGATSARAPRKDTHFENWLAEGLVAFALTTREVRIVVGADM